VQAAIADLAFLHSLPAPDLLEWAIRTYGSRFAISTSFQADGLVLVDMAARVDRSVRVFSLDTGRLPQETYDVMDAVREKYGIRVELVSPDAGEVERMTTLHGPNLFYRDTALRKLCCHIRKTRPLERKLAGFDAWAVGLRRDQSAERASIAKAEYTAGKLKLSPLADWTSAQVEEYVARHDVPRHPLSQRGYPSIGCAPCTRAVAPGEHERAGRWWWETDGSKECGIHVTPEGQMRRAVDVLLEDILVR
jgi:thioredoxin-dependent adenylylsulfate APS reductase